MCHPLKLLKLLSGTEHLILMSAHTFFPTKKAHMCFFGFISLPEMMFMACLLTISCRVEMHSSYFDLIFYWNKDFRIWPTLPICPC